jgi:hypothetical protein
LRFFLLGSRDLASGAFLGQQEGDEVRQFIGWKRAVMAGRHRNLEARGSDEFAA